MSYTNFVWRILRTLVQVFLLRKRFGRPAI